jgi:hypothetical protein
MRLQSYTHPEGLSGFLAGGDPYPLSPEYREGEQTASPGACIRSQEVSAP